MVPDKKGIWLRREDLIDALCKIPATYDPWHPELEMLKADDVIKVLGLDKELEVEPDKKKKGSA
jgi:hypothetical protein